jgi:hypothetical protein
VNGSNVVWSCEIPPLLRTEIRFWDGSFPIVPTQVTDNGLNDDASAISGANVVWSQSGIFAGDHGLSFWDGSTPTQVSDGAVRDADPDISVNRRRVDM